MMFKIEAETIYKDISGRQWESWEKAQEESESIHKKFVENHVKKSLSEYLNSHINGHYDIPTNFMASLLLNDKVVGANNIQASIERGYERAELEFALKYQYLIKS